MAVSSKTCDRVAVAEKNFSLDQFDEMAKDRSSVGAHRVQKKSHKWLIALLLVVVISPLVGVGIGTVMSIVRTGTTQAAPTTTQTVTAGADELQGTGSAAGGTGSTQESSGGEQGNAGGAGSAGTPAAEQPNLDAPISVLNGTDVEGLAARNAQKLEAAGFTAVQSDDYSEGEPTQSTIFYHGADARATAQKIAAELGVTTLTEDATKAPETGGIVVVLRND